MWRLILLISTFMFLAACGSSKDHGQLQVVNQSPASGASEVATDASISATFNKLIGSATVNTSNFTLSSQNGTVSGTLQTSGKKVTFTPNKPLSFFSKYTATVSPPIYGAFGHLLTQPYQWSFTTRDGNWNTLTAPPQSSVTNTKAAIDDNGRVMLAWSNSEGTYSSFLVNGAWATPVLLGQGGYLDSVVSGSDSYAVFWHVRNGSIIQMYCTRFAGGEWLPAEIFATVDAAAFYVIPAMFSDSSLLVIYRFNGGADGAHAYSRRFVPNLGWQPDIALPEQNEWFVAGFHRSGKAVIAWTSPGDTPATGYAQSYDVNSGWTTPVAIGKDTYLSAHSATVNSSGQGMVAFLNLNDIRVASTTSTGWTQLSPVYQMQSAGLYTPPQIAMDNFGNAMLVATEGSLSSHRYFAIRYDYLTGWQQPVDISGGKMPDLMQFINTLKVDDSGNYLLVWFGYDILPGGIEHVYSSRYQNGVGWSSPAPLGRQDADALFAKVSINPRGEAVAVWTNFYPPGDPNFTMSLGLGLFH